MIAAITLLVPIIAGWLFVYALCFRDSPQSRLVRLVLSGSLGALAGLGCSSVILFLLIWSGLASRATITVIDVIALLAGLVVFWKGRAQTVKANVAAAPEFRWIWALRVAGLIALAIVIAGWAETTAANPDGEWDAFAIWNLRAQFLAGGPSTWRFAVAAESGGQMFGANHPGYPLLTSGLIARGWILLGGAESSAPAVTGLIFVLLVALLLTGSLTWLHSESSGWLAVLVLAASETFASQTASQYADLPLACYILATMALLAAANLQEWKPSLLFLAGLMAALAAWTKNEGIVLLGITAVMVLWRGGSRRLLVFAAGALPIVAVLAAFKILLVPGVESMFPSTFGEAWTKVIDVSRWMTVAGSFIQNFWRLGFPWAHPLLMLALIAWAFGLKDGDGRRLHQWLVLIPVLMLAADFMIFVLTTADLKWHLDTSNNRLILQIWPAMLFCSFYLLRRHQATPQTTAVHPKKQRKK
ncbi:MAG: hypothetical protein JNL98_09970 [Bryobacterales bacterium]|nr:hypothetical protein [Bryobacterales bacterium]